MARAAGTRSTALVATSEFGPLDTLAEEAHTAYVDGFSGRAVELCRRGRAVSDSAGDLLTSRYLHYVEAVALQELGRHRDAVESAEALLAGLGTTAEPVWRAKALSIVAEASTRAGAHTKAMAAMGEAEWLLREIPAGTYGHLSASMAVALALRSVNLLEGADAALSSIRRAGSPAVEVLVRQELALLSAHWATTLALLDRRREAGTLFALTAARSLRMWRAARAADDSQMMARAQVIEAYAIMHLGEVDLAAARLDAAENGFSARSELVETHLMDLVRAAAAQAAGASPTASARLGKMLEDAENAGHELWATAATAALAEQYAAEHGTNRGMELWRGLAVAALHKVWAEREARFAALDDRRHLRRLSEDNDRVGAEVLRDPLTGLGNRRGLRAALQHDGDARWVIFIDVDEFKSVNDRYSHATGDAVLRRLADVLRAESRAHDVVVRYGGDEFLVLLDGTQEGAEHAAHRIHAAVLDVDWARIADGLSVTVSVGVGRSGRGDDPLAAADSAVLAAKRAGRNRVVLHQAEHPDAVEALGR